MGKIWNFDGNNTLQVYFTMHTGPQRENALSIAVEILLRFGWSVDFEIPSDVVTVVVVGRWWLD